MKFQIFLISIIASTLADSYLYPVPLERLETPVSMVRSEQQPQLPVQHQVQQYFTQDNLGQYSYGYSEPLSSKQEIRTLDGVTTGSYSYIDANGILQTVDYTADDKGFHVVATNLPKNTQSISQPIKETDEVATAREQHLAAHQAILQGDRSTSSILPKPVEDTIEVANAKKEFFARFAAEEEKQKFLRKSVLLKNQNFIVSSTPLRQLRPILSGFKAKPRMFTSFPGISAISYGYQIGGVPVKSSHYYLPVA